MSIGEAKGPSVISTESTLRLARKLHCVLSIIKERSLFERVLSPVKNFRLIFPTEKISLHIADGQYHPGSAGTPGEALISLHPQYSPAGHGVNSGKAGEQNCLATIQPLRPG